MPEIAARINWSRGSSPAPLAPIFSAHLPESRTLLHERTAAGARLCILGFQSDDDLTRQVAIDDGAQIAVLVDARLQNADHLRARFRDATASEAAIVLRAYQEWGTGLARHLRGDFAGIIWDARRQRLIGFRDELGIKPLFYSADASGVAVASDVEVLLAMTEDRGSPDDHLIVESLTWEYESTDRTFWTRLRRLGGGHVFEATADRFETRRYWFPPDERIRPLTMEEVNSRFKTLFVQGMHGCLDQRSAMLAHLSGGVDSSAIVCVADQIYREAPTPLPQIRAVSARYPGLACDEGDYIDAVTRSIGLPFEGWDGRSSDFADLDQPTVAGPGLRTHRADGSGGEFEIAKRVGARVILSGAGGDHVGAPFGVAEERARRHPVRFFGETLARRDLNARQKVRRTRFLLRAIAPKRVRSAIARHRAGNRVPHWLQPRWRDLAADLSAGRGNLDGQRFPSRIQELRWRELTGARMGYSLDADYRCAVRHGVEFRYPFLDRALVDFVLGLPCDNWPSVANHARIQKAALSSFLPPAVRDRTTKAEFSPVIAHRVKQSVDRLRTLFHGHVWASERWVDQQEARRLLDRALAGVDLRWPEWQALRAIGNLEAWLRAVFG